MTIEYRKKVQSSPHNKTNLFQLKEVGCKRVNPTPDPMGCKPGRKTGGKERHNAKSQRQTFKH
jgi:hypothetical protein